MIFFIAPKDQKSSIIEASLNLCRIYDPGQIQAWDDILPATNRKNRCNGLYIEAQHPNKAGIFVSLPSSDPSIGTYLSVFFGDLMAISQSHTHSRLETEIYSRQVLMCMLAIVHVDSILVRSCPLPEICNTGRWSTYQNPGINIVTIATT
ncbi:hypothetical protein BX600DRAFT_162685 [Xylariales sp. PMI_506]|nr:hypothetical protein BX600DRAFT_162685 [Xylariales sp. PMI_506]